MSDPYNLRPAVKFIAPYGLSECRQRLRKSSVVEKEDLSRVYKFSISTWHLPKSRNRAAFEITGKVKDKQSLQFSKFVSEVSGILTQVSESETVVEANFRTKMDRRKIMILLVLIFVSLVFVGDRDAVEFIAYIAVLVLFYSAGMLISYFLSIFNQRGTLKTLLKQVLGADKVQLRNPKDTSE